MYNFYYITGFCDKKFNFFKFAIFLQILKVQHKSFPMMYHLSYLDIKHRIQRGGGVKLTPPPAYPGFQVPQQRQGFKIQGFANQSLRQNSIPLYLVLILSKKYRIYVCLEEYSVEGCIEGCVRVVLSIIEQYNPMQCRQTPGKKKGREWTLGIYIIFTEFRIQDVGYKIQY